MARTALVMMDTRPAQLPAKSSALKLEHPQLAFELNRGYACHHGYDLLYLRMQGETCRHERLGERGPSYCKLAAVAEALHRGYSFVAFMDRRARSTDRLRAPLTSRLCAQRRLLPQYVHEPARADAPLSRSQDRLQA